MIVVLFLYALFATIFPLSKLAFNDHIQPIFFTGMRMLLGGGALLIYQYYVDKSKIVWKKEHTLAIGCLIICNIYLTNVCECWGLQYLSSVKTCFIYNLSPFFTALFSFYWLNERLSTKKWIGFVIGIIGFIPFFLEKSAAELSTGGLFFFSWPEIALITAALATVFGWIAMRQLVLDGYSPIVANGISMLASAALIMPTSVAIGETWNPFPVVHWPAALFYIVITTIISNIIAYNMYGWLLRHYTATFLTFAGFSSPFFTAVFGWFLLAEGVSWTFVLSMVIVFIGLYLFHAEERRLGATTAAPGDELKGKL